MKIYLLWKKNDIIRDTFAFKNEDLHTHKDREEINLLLSNSIKVIFHF